MVGKTLGMVWVMVLLSKISFALEESDRPRYANDQVAAFAGMLKEWKPLLENVSENLAQPLSDDMFLGIKERLGEYQRIILTYDDVAECVTIGAGHYHTEKDEYHLPEGFLYMKSQALKEIVDRIILLIDRTLTSRLSTFDLNNPLNRRRTEDLDDETVEVAVHSRLKRALHRFLACVRRHP